MPSKLLPVIPINHQGKMKLEINEEICAVVVDTGATHSTLNPTMIHQQLLWCNKNVLAIARSKVSFIKTHNCYPWPLL